LPVAKLVIAAEAPVSDEVVPPVSPVQLPEPSVRTGVFGAGESTAADLPAPRPATTIGGFADAATSKDAGGAKPVAQVGAFGSAQSDRSPHGAGSNRPVALTGFGGSSSAQNASTAYSGRPAKTFVAFETTHADVPEGMRRADVRAASFGPPSVVRNGARRRPEAVPANFDRDVEIVSKPRPQYTDEARMLGVEGEVVLEVLFGADGEVRVKRMLRGLGHGLDERAVEAASLINFLPGRRDGKAVDIVATVRIQFQLA
jgi:TonB family protein